VRSRSSEMVSKKSPRRCGRERGQRAVRSGALSLTSSHTCSADLLISSHVATGGVYMQQRSYPHQHLSITRHRKIPRHARTVSAVWQTRWHALVALKSNSDAVVRVGELSGLLACGRADIIKVMH
jgi:hypothetical protein